MSSRRIQAMARLIDEIQGLAWEWKCVGHNVPTDDCPPCAILIRIGCYRNQFQRHNPEEKP